MNQQFFVIYKHIDCAFNPSILWCDVYECAVNGECPVCGTDDIEPVSWLELSDDPGLFEITLPGYDPENGETDNLVKWVKAPNKRLAIEAAFAKWGVLIECRRMDSYFQDKCDTVGIDLIVEEGRVRDLANSKITFPGGYYSKPYICTCGPRELTQEETELTYHHNGGEVRVLGTVWCKECGATASINDQ